ncbi:tRNA pseudouridine38-40 synthase [Breznakibacter xylanolyticus]|uniref:tRNA pseudouridine synthase A n=1 Tax=Breznakibacter xylanolyticus TaxID=990 RepID=A0A2W7NB62_9BACT|nr:tRNA pseudouridine(38-40) synthase TruA [Breznakibacter xylanolyticus]MBN2743312.1 tRNA pseudouridine(38-40) synthase TruA [Marinilabiliaceae bacterium]PZX15367.1 tRNA pseudouridine38-40 synthase [Breznakibacter xylanolyticus]
MTRYFIELAYNGSRYHGWQIQPNGITIQELLQDAFFKATRVQTDITGCGRTDTGVHASYFVAHFDMPEPLVSTLACLEKVNRILPPDIAVYSIQEVEPEAHSRFSAVARRYEYRLSLYKNPFQTQQAYFPRFTPDFEKMNQAAALLFNYQDFTSFSKLHGNAKTNICRIDLAQWEQQGSTWVFTIQADRFLRNMVRAIVGTLLEVGRGKISAEQFCDIIERKNRSEAGMSVPAHALSLVDIHYPASVFKPTPGYWLPVR